MNTEMEVCVKKGDEWLADALVHYLNDKIHDFIKNCISALSDESLSNFEKKSFILRSSEKCNSEIHEVIGFSFVFLEMFKPDAYSDMFDNVSDVVLQIREEFFSKINKEC